MKRIFGVALLLGALYVQHGYYTAELQHMTDERDIALALEEWAVELVQECEATLEARNAI